MKMRAVKLYTFSAVLCQAAAESRSLLKQVDILGITAEESARFAHFMVSSHLMER